MLKWDRTQAVYNLEIRLKLSWDQTQTLEFDSELSLKKSFITSGPGVIDLTYNCCSSITSLFRICLLLEFVLRRYMIYTLYVYVCEFCLPDKLSSEFLAFFPVFYRYRERLWSTVISLQEPVTDLRSPPILNQNGYWQILKTLNSDNANVSFSQIDYQHFHQIIAQLETRSKYSSEADTYMLSSLRDMTKSTKFSSLQITGVTLKLRHCIKNSQDIMW